MSVMHMGELIVITHLTESYRLHTILGKVYGEENRDTWLGNDWSDTDILRMAKFMIKCNELIAIQCGIYAVPAFKESYVEDLIRFYNDLSRLTGNAERLDWTTVSYGGQPHMVLFFTEA